MIFKIVTYNILNTSTKYEDRRKIIKRQIWTNKAHVYGLQQINYTTYQQLSELAVNKPKAPLYFRGLPQGQLQVLRGKKQVLDGSPYGEKLFQNDGVAMLFSMPAVRKEYFEILHLSATNVAQRAKFSLPNGLKVWVYNVHLHYMRKNAEVRFYQLIDLIKWIDKNPYKAENEPEFITGDFNMEPSQMGYEYLEDEGFMSVMKTINGNELPTYPSGLKGQYVPVTPNFCLDYIWYRVDGIRPLQAKLIGDQPHPTDPDLFGSDHKGIYAQFQMVEMKPKL